MDSSPSFKKLLVRSLLLLGPSLVAAQGGNLASCLDSAGVPYILDSAPNWANETSPWQLRLKDDVSPAALAYPTDTDHIAACLACAEETKTKVSVLSGGHSFVAYGFGDPGNLVINMAAFNTCSYDAASETYTMGGGTRVGPAVKQLWEENQRHFAHVRHGRVGVVGASIGGGFGTTSRFLGTPMDNIAGAEIMLANGTIVDAKPGSDLLWAISGAGSSFGVIISLTTKTWQPAHANITTFTITLSPEQGPDGAASAVIAAQEMALAGEIPDELALRFQFSKKPGYNTLGYYYGDPKDFDSVIQPLMDKMPANTTIESESVEFFEAESTIAVGAKLPQGGTSPPRTFYIQSLTTTADHPLSLETVTLAFQRATVDFDRPDLKSSGFFDIYGGFSKNVKDSDHAHAIGNVLWFIRMDTNTMKNDDPWPVDGTSYGKSILLPFEEALTAANQPLRGFANYRDSELTEDQWSSRLYGENYGRLKEIKAAYDPTGMFTNNKQSIA
ncbi:putative glucooligosaccharide oxidase [Drepanopeziza brunnea f. sp. 'multigermtubi' MB_m1]|uniref:Putative glucooligosaccharide oxidase n=2 Tax=Drepanopeziza brunnea f. sp. 'multigermtubi' TaxID=698441 RepID=K1WWP2_MARBU|nr:putative glucooligosaccharide oxidase [Drepanopeziza brunnea f. sp. 'multigermtubi' MB_m1]EKD16947.1 putative glucooligosaccharide oxidase [Drepanopeziza brunnea f. sp. 'multigermtubi' MB_m1]